MNIRVKDDTVKIDRRDIGLLGGRRLCVYDAGHTKYCGVYLSRRKFVLIHRIIMRPPRGKDVDHMNRNGLDNRRSNLRVCSRSENCQGSKRRYVKSSKYIGVSFEKYTRKYRTSIGKNGKDLNLGRFSSEIDAAMAYNRAAVALYGPLAKINYVEK